MAGRSAVAAADLAQATLHTSFTSDALHTAARANTQVLVTRGYPEPAGVAVCATRATANCLGARKSVIIVLFAAVVAAAATTRVVRADVELAAISTALVPG